MAGNESITDIQNYLQTFNKEIGEESNQQGQTYYAIDTSQVKMWLLCVSTRCVILSFKRKILTSSNLTN